MEKRACPDFSDETYVIRLKSVRRLRDSIESLLDETYKNLCTRTSYRAAPAIKRYLDRRQQMVRFDMSKSDIEYYDGRFQGLPWEIAGLETPRLD
jgi:hypothetical protein